MFCKNCGKELCEQAVICPNCGVPINKEIFKSEQKTNVLAIFGLVLSFFVPLAGLICSILGYKKSSEFEDNSKSLALAGIIISSIILGLILIALAIYFSIVIFLFFALGSIGM